MFRALHNAMRMVLSGILSPRSYLDTDCLVIISFIITQSCCMDKPRIRRALRSRLENISFSSIINHSFFWLTKIVKLYGVVNRQGEKITIFNYNLKI